MRIGLLIVPVLLAGTAVWPAHGQAEPHVVVEVRSLTVDEARLGRVGLAGAVLSTGDVEVAAGRGGGLRIGTRVGSLDVTAWLDLARRERAVERETTQRIVVLSGAEARLGSTTTLTGPFGASAVGGPELWVLPSVVEGDRVHLRLWSAVGEVVGGPYGMLQRDAPLEATTEIVVPSGTPFLIADASSADRRSERGMLSRGEASRARSGWMVVTVRVVGDLSDVALPAGIPEEWLRQ